MANGTWTITDDSPRMVKSGGDTVDGRRITYQTGNGVSGYIDVPLTDYNAPKVKALIAAAVAQHDEIGMGSTTPPAT